MISLTIFCFLLKVAGMFRDNSIGKIKVTYVVSRLMIITNKEVLTQDVIYFLSVSMGASHSTKITDENSETPRTNGTVHCGCTDPTQATARLVIVHVSRIQKSGTGDNNFVNWKKTFRSDRTVKVDHLQSWFQIFRSDQTEVVSSV